MKTPLPNALRCVLGVAILFIVIGISNADSHEIIYGDVETVEWLGYCASGCNLSTDAHENNNDGLWGASGANQLITRYTSSTEFPYAHFAIPISCFCDQVLPESLRFEIKAWSYAPNNDYQTIEFSPDNSTWYEFDYNQTATFRNVQTDSPLVDTLDILDFINSSNFLNIYLKPNTTALSDGLSFSGFNMTAILYNLSETFLTNCSNTNHVNVLNLSLFNESNSATVVGDIDAAFDVLLDNGTIRPIGFDFNNDSDFYVCIYPPEGSPEANLTFQYYGDDYSTREYYELNRTLDNISEALSLYLLHDSDSTLWKVMTANEVGSDEPDIYINIERYYPELNSYTEVARMRTDSNGEDETNLLYHTAFYRFNFTDGWGESYLLTTPAKVTETDVTYTLSILGDINIYSYVDSVSVNWTLIGTNLTFNTIDESNYMTSTCYLIVEITNGSSEQVLNDSCIVGSPTVFTTGINTSLPHYASIIMFYGTEKWTVFSDYIEPTVALLYGLTGVLLGLVIAITFSMAGTELGPTGVVLGFVFGYGFSLAIGFIRVSDVMAHLVGIVSITFVIMYFMGTRRAFG